MRYLGGCGSVPWWNWGAIMLNPFQLTSESDNLLSVWIYRSCSLMFLNGTQSVLCFLKYIFGLSQSLAVIISTPFLQSASGLPSNRTLCLDRILVLAAFFGKAVAHKRTWYLHQIKIAHTKKTSVSNWRFILFKFDRLECPKGTRFSVLFFVH